MQEQEQPLRLIWLLAIFILLIFTFQVVSEYLSTGIRLGISIQQNDQVVEIVAVRHNSPAQRANLLPGSALKTINGVPIQKISDIAPALKLTGNTSNLTIEHDGKLYTLQITPGTPVNYRSLVLNLLLIVVYLSIALAAMHVGRIEPKIRLLGWFSLAVAFDIATHFSMSYWPQAISIYSIFKNMLASLQFALIFHLLSLIPRPAPWMQNRMMPGLLYPLVLGTHLLFLLVFFELLSLGDFPFAVASFVFENNASFLSWGIIVLSILLYQFYHTRATTERQQVKWILASIIPWVLLQFSDLLVPNVDWVYSEWYDLIDKLTHMIFPLGILAAIFRYNLLDLSELFPRNYFYGLLTTLLLAIPGIAVLETGILVAHAHGSEPAIWGSGLAMLALGHAFSPIRHYLAQLIEGGNWYHQHHLGQDLRQLTEEISNVGSLDIAKRRLSSRLARLMHSSKVIIYLDTAFINRDASRLEAPENHPFWPDDDGKRTYLDDLHLDKLSTPLHLSSSKSMHSSLSHLYGQGLELIFPLQLQQDNLGVLLLGKSLGGRRYSWRETELLNLFAQNIAAWFAHASLNSQMMFDELTGLYRRKAIITALEQCTLDFRISGSTFSIAMIDLDDFKMVNDRYGHLGGDEVLKRSTAAAGLQLRDIDKLGRYGGEEFLLVMPELDHVQAIHLCEKICSAIENLQHSQPVATTVSIGVASILEVQTQGITTEQLTLALIALADNRLYQAKANGKNQVTGNAKNRNTASGHS